MGTTRMLLSFIVLMIFCILKSCDAQYENNEAPKECTKNAVWMKCGPNCDKVCATLNEPCYVNYFVCPSGCYCAEGHARDTANECVPIDQCHK